MLELFKKSEPLSKHTNFRIGGPAKYFFEAKTSEDIIKAVVWSLQNKVEFFVLGGGSNILVSDAGFNGLVIKAANRNFKIDRENYIVTAEAGLPSAMLARKSAEAGLADFEWAISLPGTIGGAVRGNAGCFGGEIKDFLSSARVLKINEDGCETAELNNKDCKFAYRDSIFKHESLVILDAEFCLRKSEASVCLGLLDKHLSLRKEKQPLESGSAGCVFKNFQFSSVSPMANFQIPNVPEEFLKNKKIPAGWLIERTGLKGLKIGGAEISSKHGNFLLNKDHAKAEDVINLVRVIKEKVKSRLGVDLHEEIQCVGF